MPGWLILEDSDAEIVFVFETEHLTFAAKQGIECVEVVFANGGHRVEWCMQSWKEVERLINLLPGIDNYGWILVRDGKVNNWRGRLAVKEVKELTEEEENEVLEESGRGETHE